MVMADKAWGRHNRWQKQRYRELNKINYAVDCRSVWQECGELNNPPVVRPAGFLAA